MSLKLKWLLLLSLIIFIPVSFSFSWSYDSKENNQIAVSSKNQVNPASIPDGSGGAFITWSEQVDGNDFNIYCQRVDTNGIPVWSLPVLICTAPGFQGMPVIVKDGLGGAIIAWQDSRDLTCDLDIYAQRIDADGKVLWDENGVVVVSQPSWQYKQVMVSDNNNGAIIAWNDGRKDISQVYVQRIDKDGKPVWKKNGILVANVTYGQADPDVISDSLGGAVLAWSDYRPVNNINIYAQKVDANGSLKWGDEGMPICTVVGNQYNAKVLSDGSNGVIISWTDGRTGDEELDIFTQKVSSSGEIAWKKNGIPVCNAEGGQYSNVMVSDNVGGAIIAWEDSRSGTDTDIYAQRIYHDGVIAWSENGIPISATAQFQRNPAVLPDGSGGAYISWEDFYREGKEWNIYAQRVDAKGNVAWVKDGCKISIADGAQTNISMIPAGQDGVNIFWTDSRAGDHSNIYGQYINSKGMLAGGKFYFFTASADGVPKTSFEPGEVIMFKVFWLMQAPLTTGTYKAQAGMLIHTDAQYKQDTVEYTIEK